MEALLDRTASWVKTKTPALLRHEKGHFNITELFARKLRKEIMSKLFKGTTLEDELFALHKQFGIAMDAHQDRYDSETDFSRNVEKQELWETSIENQLYQLQSYKEIQIELKIDRRR